jgi:hypothetical protein
MPNTNPAHDSKRPDQTSEGRERTRTSNDCDRQLERRDTTPHDRDRGPAARRTSRDTDPDSPDADIDRDDMSDEP